MGKTGKDGERYLSFGYPNFLLMHFSISPYRIVPRKDYNLRQSK